ncbi:hypothetical protein [Faunimonas sp. B44]|uniref:hypothetical protein n=1 Tax=Faunimonas sp. B44 TaxID=3461493 RepID=UPI004044F85F
MVNNADRAQEVFDGYEGSYGITPRHNEERKYMTLTIAREAFRADPTNVTAAKYLDQAHHYYMEDTIGDDTFLNAVAEVKDYLSGSTTFTFDVFLEASFTIQAPDEETAKNWLETRLDCVEINAGALPSGDPIVGEANFGGYCRG